MRKFCGRHIWMVPTLNPSYSECGVVGGRPRTAENKEGGGRGKENLAPFMTCVLRQNMAEYTHYVL